MMSGQASSKYLFNTLMYLLMFFILLDIASNVNKTDEDFSTKIQWIKVDRATNKCSKLYDQFFKKIKQPSVKKQLKCNEQCIIQGITSQNDDAVDKPNRISQSDQSGLINKNEANKEHNKDEEQVVQKNEKNKEVNRDEENKNIKRMTKMLDQFKKCAVEACEQIKSYTKYKVHFGNGIIFQHNSHNFECYYTQLNKEEGVLIRQQRCISLKDQIIGLFMDTIMEFFISHQTNERIKQFVNKLDFSYESALAIGLIAVFIVMFFGDGVDKIKKWYKSLTGKKQLVPKTHNQKIQDGCKLIEYLHHFQREKMKHFKIKKRNNVDEIIKLIKFIEKVQHNSIKLISGNQGVGLQSSLQNWIQQRTFQGRKTIYYNLKYVINCSDRLGLENNCVSNLDCIMEYIIFENDRYIADILFTTITMTVNYCFKFVYQILSYPKMVALKNTFFSFLVALLVRCTNWYIWIKLAIGIILFIILYFRLLKRNTPNRQQLQNSIQNLPFQLKNWICEYFCKDQPQNKTIILFDNIQLVMSEIANSNDPRKSKDQLQFLLNFLRKCHQAQQLKNHDIILVSRDAFCTNTISNRNGQLSIDFKYDEQNLYQLRHESVMKIIFYREGQRKTVEQNTKFFNMLNSNKQLKNLKQCIQRGSDLKEIDYELLPYGLLFSYFFDNTEQIFKSMRRVSIDKKYNKKQCHQLAIDNQEILVQTIFQEINKVIDDTKTITRLLLQFDKFKCYSQKKKKPTKLTSANFNLLVANILYKLISVILFGITLETKNQKKSFIQIKDELKIKMSQKIRPENVNEQFNILFKVSLDDATRSIILFMSKWYQFTQNPMTKVKFQILCKQFQKDKECEAIAEYLNDRKIFYFYNFLSSVHALAYFIDLCNFKEIKCNLTFNLSKSDKAGAIWPWLLATQLTSLDIKALPQLKKYQRQKKT